VTNITIRNDITVKLIDVMGSDSGVVAAAKVSTQGAASEECLNQEANLGLINFLMRNRHGTPFEHNSMTFLIEAPIMVFREFHRHRIGWSYNEESARYKQLDGTFYIPADTRPLVQEGKPGHYVFVEGTVEQQQIVWRGLFESYAKSYQTYLDLLEQGIAKEIARACLPVAIFSSMYATCNTRSLMAFLSLRTKDERATFPSFPMHEIAMVGNAMEGYFAEQFPAVYHAYNEAGRVCP
jgi:thymidylate synthase (FAD)